MQGRHDMAGMTQSHEGSPGVDVASVSLQQTQHLKVCQYPCAPVGQGRRTKRAHVGVKLRWQGQDIL